KDYTHWEESPAWFFAECLKWLDEMMISILSEQAQCSAEELDAMHLTCSVLLRELCEANFRAFFACIQVWRHTRAIDKPDGRALFDRALASVRDGEMAHD